MSIKMGHSKKDPYPTPERKFPPSGEGREGIVDFLHVRYGSFLEQPNLYRMPIEGEEEDY